MKITTAFLVLTVGGLFVSTAAEKCDEERVDECINYLTVQRTLLKQKLKFSESEMDDAAEADFMKTMEQSLMDLKQTKRICSVKDACDKEELKRVEEKLAKRRKAFKNCAKFKEVIEKSNQKAEELVKEAMAEKTKQVVFPLKFQDNEEELYEQYKKFIELFNAGEECQE